MDRATLDSMLDRVAGATAATLFVLCLAFALVIWWRVFFYRPAMLSKGASAPMPPAMSDNEVKSVVVAVAVAMSACAVRYFQIAGGRFGSWGYGSFEYDLTAVTTDVIVLVAVIYSIRQATHNICGAAAGLAFAALAALSGVASYLWV